MAVASRRIPGVIGIMVGVLAILLPGSPASAQTGGPGAQATPVVGVSGTAACPTNVGAAQVPYIGPAGPFAITQSAGSCSSFSASAQGSFTIGGGTGTFAADCQGAGLQHGIAVHVPQGTIINPGPGQTVAGAGGATITTLNTPVIFPGGTAATLNVVSTTPTTVTRTAIVAGGTQIGQVICNGAAYPLAVETASGASSAPLAPLTSSDDDGGSSITLLLAGAFALAVAGQLLIGRRVWRRKGDATV